jgi:adenylate cyclase
VSAYGDMSNIRTAMNRGAFDFLTKPIDFLDLETTIAKTIRHIEVLREARRRQAEAERAHASLSRYFSPNLAERLARDADAIDLGGHRREIATLFTDIASFTALVETLEPEALGPLLNDYLTGMTDIVFAQDGTVAKIVGDACMCCSGLQASSPTMPAALSNAHWLWMNTHNHSASVGTRKELRWESHVSVFMQGRRSSAISAAAASSTTRPTAIP